FTWSKFWLKESRQPFRYTCSVESIKRMEFSPEIQQLGWLAPDLCRLLSQRIERLSFVNAAPPAEKAEPGSESKKGAGSAPTRPRSHIRVGGIYVVRAQTNDPKSLALEIMPDVSIGADMSPRTLAYPVCYPPDAETRPLKIVKSTSGEGLGEVKLTEFDYRAI